MVNNDAQHHLYIVECPHKRRKLLTKASLTKEDQNYFQDELLVEILCRLPHSKYAIQCKSVCKSWAALISDPYFAGRFIASKLPCLENIDSISGLPEQKLTRFNESDIEIEKMERSFVIVARNEYRDSSKGVMMHLENPISNLCNFSLSSLPCSVGENATKVSVVGAHNDLLMYCREASDRYYYYIYNIQTRQWLSLPSTPFYYGQFVTNGFVCDPYYSFEGGKVIFNAACKFSIVVCHCPAREKIASKHKIHLFSSNSSQWTTKVLLLPRNCGFIVKNNRSFAFAGKLHIRVRQGMIGFDPCGGEKGRKGAIRCHLISWPPGVFYGKVCVGVRQGQLQIANFDEGKLFTTWVLKDYGKGEWSLVHKIAPHQWLARGSFASKQETMLVQSASVVGQHPSNPDIIYVSRHRYLRESSMMCSVLMCDTSMRTVKLACHLTTSMRIDSCFTSYSLTLPIWPTPLPTLV